MSIEGASLSHLGLEPVPRQRGGLARERRARTRRRAARPRLLRAGVGPYLAGLDLLAWTSVVLVTGHLDVDHLVLLVLSLALLTSSGAYRSRLLLSALEDYVRNGGRVLVAATLTTCFALVADRPHPEAVLVTAPAFAALLVMLRAVGYAVVRGARARGLVVHRTLVLGAGRVGAQLVQLMQEHPEYGLQPVGFLDENPLLSPAELPVPVLGSADTLARVIEEQDIEDVIVAFGGLPGHELVEVLRTCDRLNCEIFFVPRLYELHSTAGGADSLWGLPLIRHRRAAFRSATWPVKRLLDVLLSGLSLLLLAPVLVLIGLAVRLEGGPGIIFKQTRVGLDNRPFQLLKFRTLRPVDETESATRWNIALDDRLGPVGRFLRQTSLDELPQLWNILRGDMSVVGPRPERPHFVDAFASTLPRYIARHRVPAGLTGWAQVHGLRGDTSIAERARFDNYYIENWSLRLDVRIMLLTFIAVLTRRGG